MQEASVQQASVEIIWVFQVTWYLQLIHQTLGNTSWLILGKDDNRVEVVTLSFQFYILVFRQNVQIANTWGWNNRVVL